jgi:hypothetical protein
MRSEAAQARRSGDGVRSHAKSGVSKLKPQRIKCLLPHKMNLILHNFTLYCAALLDL